MSFTTIAATTLGLADGDQNPTPVSGTVRITPRHPAGTIDSGGVIATGPVIVTITGGAFPSTAVPAREDSTARVEFHLYTADGPVRMPDTEIPLTPGATIDLRDHLPAGVDPATGQALVRGERGPGITDITADSGVVTVEWEGGDDVTIPIPTAALATPASDGLMPAADKAKLDVLSGGAFALTLAPGSAVPIVWAGASSAANVLVTPEQGFPWLVTRGLQAITPSGYGTETRPQHDRDANFTRHTQAGVHGYNVAVNGFQSDNYLSHLVTDAISSLRPAIVFHYVGTQDYKAQRPVNDFETRVRGWVTTLNGKLETPAQHVFVSQYERLDPPIVPIIAGWGEYRDALRRIADDHGTFIDAHPIFQRLRYDQDDPHGLMANQSSLSAAGHRVMADTILDALLGGKRTR